LLSPTQTNYVDEALPAAPAGGGSPAAEELPRRNGWLRSAVATLPVPSKLLRIGYSFADLALAVGGMFLANVALARTQSKEEYGVFALSYSVFTFLAGLHNAAILETYTVYGSGRYHARFTDYVRLLWRSNALLGLALTGAISIVWGALAWCKPALASPAILGLALSCGVLLTATFVRRTFYIRRRPDLAARFSLVFFAACALLLWVAIRVRVLSGFSVFAIAALAWIVAGLGLRKKFALGRPAQSFLDSEPGYWREHWKYSKWVFASTFVYQFTAQAYYWILAGFLSVREVGELRAMYLLVAPVDQVIIAVGFLVVPALAARHASGRMEDFFALLKRSAMGVLVMTALFAVVVRIAGSAALHFLYRGKFDDLAPLLYVLACLPLVMAIGNALGYGLNAAEKPKLVFGGFLSSGAATLALGIPLVIHFGLQGAVYGMLPSAGVYTAVQVLGFFLAVYRKAIPVGVS